MFHAALLPAQRVLTRAVGKVAAAMRGKGCQLLRTRVRTTLRAREGKERQAQSREQVVQPLAFRVVHRVAPLPA